MKTKSLLAIGAAFMVAITAQGQTTNTGVTKLAYDIKTFFTDQTNLFNQGTVQSEVGPLVNINNWHVGADADIQFPIAQQASVGFDLMYYNNTVYDGTFNGTIGMTWNVIGQPVYTYGQVGIGTDLQNVNNIINVEWVGGRTYWTVAHNVIKNTDTMKVSLNLAGGHISNDPGFVAKIMAGFEWDF